MLKELVVRETEPDDADHDTVQQRLQCIVTAFELLSGQGAASPLDACKKIIHSRGRVLSQAKRSISILPTL